MLNIIKNNVKRANVTGAIASKYRRILIEILFSMVMNAQLKVVVAGSFIINSYRLERVFT